MAVEETNTPPHPILKEQENLISKLIMNCRETKGWAENKVTINGCGVNGV